jgi:hypothetical protein
LFQMLLFMCASHEPAAHELTQWRSQRRGRILDAERRKRGWQIGGDELVDVLCIGQPAELVRAQVAQRGPLGSA